MEDFLKTILLFIAIFVVISKYIVRENLFWSTNSFVHLLKFSRILIISYEITRLKNHAKYFQVYASTPENQYMMRQRNDIPLL